MADVVQKFSGDPSALQKALADLSRDYVRLENRLNSLTQTSRRGADEALRDSQRRRQALADEARVFQSQARVAGNPWGSAHVQNQRLAAQAANPWISAHQAMVRQSEVKLNGQQLAAALDGVEEKQGRVNSLWNSGVASLGQLTGGIVTVGAVVQAYNRDLERQIQLQTEALATHRLFSRGQAEIVLNTFGQSPQQRQHLRAEAARISAATGVPEPMVASSLGRLAGKGVGLTPQQLVAAQEMATRLGRHTPEQIEPLSTAILQTMRISGLGVEDSAALIQSASAAAFIGEPWQQARFLQQSLSGMAANIPGGGRQAVEQSLELAAYISQAVGEERGEAGRTSAIAMAAQLNEFREGRGPWAVTLQGGRKLNTPVKGMPTNPIDAIQWLQQNPGMAKRFLDRATFEQLFEGEWRNLLTGGDKANTLLQQTRDAVGPQVGALREQLAALESETPQLTHTALDSQGAAAIEQFKGGATRSAVTASLRKMRDEAFAAASRHRHLTPFEVGIMSTGFDVPIVGHVPGIRDSAGYAKNQQAEYFLGDIKAARDELLQYGLSTKRPDQLGAEQKLVYDLLSKLIENGEKQLEELKKITKPQPTGPALNVERGRHTEK